jgi:hypothetical protein
MSSRHVVTHKFLLRVDWLRYIFRRRQDLAIAVLVMGFSPPVSTKYRPIGLSGFLLSNDDAGTRSFGGM